MMKYVMIILSGAADQPIEDLGDATPLAVSRMPNVSQLTKTGRIGTVRTVPKGLAPGPVAGTISLLGTDPLAADYDGPAVLEAIAAGLDLEPNDCVIACDFVAVDEDGRMSDTAIEGIGESDARMLLEALATRLSEELGDEAARGLSFIPLSTIGSGGLLIDRSGKREYQAVDSEPATSVLGSAIRKRLPRGGGEAAELLNTIMKLSAEVFAQHEVTQTRAELGEPIITQLWLHSPGNVSQLRLRPFAETHRRNARLLADSMAVLGLGQVLGMDVAAYENPDLPRFMDERRKNASMIAGGHSGVSAATEDDMVLSTSAAAAEAEDAAHSAEPIVVDETVSVAGYHMLVDEVARWLTEGTGSDASEAPDDQSGTDILIIHVSSPDVASHHGDFKTKIEMLERIDRELIGPVFDQLQSAQSDGDWRMMVVADHLADSATRLDSGDSVPFAMAGLDVVSVVDRELFNEEQADDSDLHVEAGHDLMEYFLVGGLRGR